MWVVGTETWETYSSSSLKTHWHRDEEGNKVCTKPKNNDPFAESSRQWELHAPETAAVPCKVTSLGEAATNLMNDIKQREIFINREIL